MGEIKPHVVAVPSLAQGHLIPFLQLAKLLASHGGFTVSFITTPGNAKRLQPEVEGSNLDIRLVPIPLPPIDGVPPGIDSTDNVPMHLVPLLFASSHKLAAAFQEWLDQQMKSNNISGTSPVCCIIVDMTTGWARRAGANLGIPSVAFYTCGAFALSLMHSVFNRKSWDDDELFEVSELIFGLKLRRSELTVSWRDPESHPLWDFLREELNGSLEGLGIIINTFYELEARAVDYIGSLTGNPVWSIGPLLPHAVLEHTEKDRRKIRSRGKAADIDEDECLRWLDSRRPNSVIFVCLGSQFFLNENQICALASGLETSGQDFVWAIRCRTPQTDLKDCKETEVGLAEGFEERTRERGLIIWGWAPQLLILSHPSVGAFLSHCGWNSTLESISVGVPMITWPMFAEQPFNSKLLVERLGIAVQICLDVSGIPDEGEVRRAVTMLLAEEEGETMRARAKTLSKVAKMAVDKEGSSYINLESFVQEMQKLHHNLVVLPHVNGYNE